MLIAPEVSRPEPPLIADEQAMLNAFLDYHRATLLWKCSGLDEEQLRRRASPPSTLSLLGLVRHMTEVERSWFLRGVGGRDAPPLYFGDDNPDGDFDDVDTADPEADLAAYAADCAAAREVLATAGLDDTFTGRSSGQTYSVRYVYLHMLEEYARHNGHADLIRQSIDGATGE